MKVLIADDDLFFQAKLRNHLETMGHVVETASDGRQASVMLLEHFSEFDAVITDMQMPYMTGHDLLQVIWARGTIPTLLHSSESTAYIKSVHGRNKVELSELIKYFDFALFQLKSGGLSYIDNFLASIRP